MDGSNDATKLTVQHDDCRVCSFLLAGTLSSGSSGSSTNPPTGQQKSVPRLGARNTRNTFISRFLGESDRQEGHLQQG